MSENNGFSKNPDLYRSSLAHSELQDLEAASLHLPPVSDLAGLDIATGTGHTAFYFSRKQAHMFAVDVNQNMLNVAQEESDKKTLSVRFLRCPAEELMFDDESFDFATCRLAAHHFSDPQEFLTETARVLRPNGHLLLIDNVIPDDNRETGLWINEFEKKRDDTHASCLSETEWETRLKDQKFQVVHKERFKKKLSYKAWMERMSKSPEEQEELWQELLGAPNPVLDFWGPKLDSKGQKNLTLQREIFIAKL